MKKLEILALLASIPLIAGNFTTRADKLLGKTLLELKTMEQQHQSKIESLTKKLEASLEEKTKKLATITAKANLSPLEQNPKL